MGKEDYVYLEKEEFESLDNKQKWNYIASLVKMIKNYKIQAELNCAECDKNLFEAKDLNIDMYFEDWRECSDHCDECTEEDRVNMCDLQFNIINHLANSVGSLTDQYNMLVKLVLKKDDPKNTIIKKWKKDIKKVDDREKHANDMFQ